jgi:group I intron endonuclease
MEIKNILKDSGIYCIINISNKKRYIGSSVNVHQRLQKHRSMLRKNYHQNRKLQNSWNKNSEKFFECYILEYCNNDDLEKREQFYIDTLKPEFNITLIVERNILSKESRLLQSETRKRKILSGEIKLSCEKIIYQYDLNGIFIKKYDSIKKACIENNIHQSTICRFLNGTYRKGGNYLWSLNYEEKLQPYIKQRKEKGLLNKSVKIIDFNDNIIFTFTSLKECAKYFNTYPTCISYSIKHQTKFKRKYYIKFNI